MEVKFIGQALEDKELSVGTTIIQLLKSGNYEKFKAYVAFVSASGIMNLKPSIDSFIESSGEAKFYVGVDMNGTSKEALEKFLEYNYDVSIVYSSNRIIFHPKIFLLEGGEKSSVIVGSSNLTTGGLFQNIESSVLLNYDNNDSEILNSIISNMNYLESDDTNCIQPLTEDLLEKLVASKIVLSESTILSKKRRSKSEFNQANSNSLSEVNALFGKTKGQKPPYSFSKSSQSRRVMQDEDGVKVIVQDMEISEDSMWIETKKMTGGSMNQLDLSKNGKRGDVEIPGSVTYFGIDPNETHTSKNIDIIFQDSVYKNNPIDYREGNSNWRLLLKGITEDGDKLTEFSRLKIDKKGGFVDKILFFHRTNSDVYELEVLDKDEIDRLINLSVNWAYMGNQTTGRTYGFI